MSERRPQQIDEFKINRIISSGKRFNVYLAVNQKGENVALKVASNRSARDLAHLRREWEVTRHLAVEGVRRIYEVRQSSDGYIYSVLEWGNRSLRQELESGRHFSRGEIIKLMGAVAKTLDEIHARDYVHTDLTPEHILIDNDGRVLIAGLSQARCRGQKPGRGDPRYHAPECSNGQPVGPWCDIYSLGVIVYEMFTGTLPFQAKSPEEWQRAHAIIMPELPRSLQRALGTDASRAILRALAKEPGDRSHSATVFIEGLREEEAATTRLRSALGDFFYGLFRSLQHIPRLAKLALLLLFILGGAAVLVIHGKQGRVVATADPRTATAEFVAALQTPDTIWTPKPLGSPEPTRDTTATAAAVTITSQPTKKATATANTATVPVQTPTATPEPTTAQQALHPAPTLIEPADVTHFAAGSAVPLSWEYNRPLEAGEAFDIRMWKTGQPAYGIARSAETNYYLRGAPQGSGEYNWMIVVVRDDASGKVVETSQRSAIRRIFWD